MKNKLFYTVALAAAIGMLTVNVNPGFTATNYISAEAVVAESEVENQNIYGDEDQGNDAMDHEYRDLDANEHIDYSETESPAEIEEYEGDEEEMESLEE